MDEHVAEKEPKRGTCGLRRERTASPSPLLSKRLRFCPAAITTASQLTLQRHASRESAACHATLWLPQIRVRLTLCACAALSDTLRSANSFSLVQDSQHERSDEPACQRGWEYTALSGNRHCRWLHRLGIPPFLPNTLSERGGVGDQQGTHTHLGRHHT